MYSRPSTTWSEPPSFRADEFSQELRERVGANPRYTNYAHRVLLGFSSGGTAALEYISKHPDTFDTAILYAPYLGPEFIIREIIEAGGLAGWTPTGPVENQELLWTWLKNNAARDRVVPRLYILWGLEDEAAPGLPLLQEYLPRGRIMVGEGEHGWPAFNDIWPRFVREHHGAFR